MSTGWTGTGYILSSPASILNKAINREPVSLFERKTETSFKALKFAFLKVDFNNIFMILDYCTGRHQKVELCNRRPLRTGHREPAALRHLPPLRAPHQPAGLVHGAQQHQGHGQDGGELPGEKPHPVSSQLPGGTAEWG